MYRFLRIFFRNSFFNIRAKKYALNGTYIKKIYIYIYLRHSADRGCVRGNLYNRWEIKPAHTSYIMPRVYYYEYLYTYISTPRAENRKSFIYAPMVRRGGEFSTRMTYIIFVLQMFGTANYNIITMVHANV